MSNMQTINERIITVEISPTIPQTWNVEKLMLVAIYTPATPSDRRSFYQQLTDALDGLDHTVPTIIIGDFNLDFHRRESRSQHIRQLLTYASPIENDIPTFHRGKHHSTIDHALLNTQAKNKLNKFEVIPSPPSLTDHSMISLGLEIASIKQGPGWWKLNTSILKETKYKTVITDFLEFIFTADGPFHYTTIDRMTAEEYDSLKQMLRHLSLEYSQKRARENKKTESHLHAQINQWSLPNNAQEDMANARIQSLLLQLDQIQKEKLEGQAVRARINWREKGEKSTAYFYRTLKIRQAKAQIAELTHPVTNQSCNTANDILAATTSFYDNLFTPTFISTTETDTFLQDTPSSVLNEDDISLCLKHITKDEVLQALIDSPKQKAPGNDGLPFEFYDTFQKTILIDIITHQCNQTLQHLSIPESWNSTNTVLIHKKNNRNDLRNWRPIALINTDNKIFSRILASRIQLLATKCVNQYQTGFIRGRYIADNAASAILLMEHAQKMRSADQTTPCMILLDQEKAYDRVHPEYFALTLKHFGFPEQLTKCISKLFFQSKTRVAVNGYLTRPIRQRRGLRQGDPLSPILYNLMLEPLLRSFQTKMTGYKLNHTLSLTCMAYADDTILFINSPEELQHSMKIYDKYAKVSNAKLNDNKTIGVVMRGTAGPWQSHFPQYQWFDSNSSTCPTYLGYPLSPYKRHHLHHYDIATQKIRNHVNLLSGRSLSQAGKALVINSLLTSKLWHIARLIPLESHEQKINTILRNFFWSSRNPTLAWKYLCQPKHNGGMGIIPIKDQSLALRVRHLTPIFVPSHPFRSFFHDILEEIIKQLCGNNDHLPFLLSSSSFPQLMKGFYFLPNLTKILSCINNSFHNTYLLSSTFLALPLSMFLQPSTHIPKKLLLTPLHHFTRGWPPQNHLMISTTTEGEPQYKRKKLKKLLRTEKAKWITELPFQVDWVSEALEDVPTPSTSANSIQNLMKETFIGGTSISHITTAAARSFISKKFDLPSSKIHISCTQVFYTSLWKLSIPQYDKVVWWKLSLNRWPCRRRLHKLYPLQFPSPNCEICSDTEEDADHMLILCPIKNRFWKYVRVLINIWTNDKSTVPARNLHAKNIIEGFQYLWSKKTLNKNPTTMIILSMAISTIWKQHWSFIFREDRSQSLTYNHLKNAMWKTLSDRIMDDNKKYQKNSIWIRKGIVNWTSQNAALITYPSIHIAE
jgi:hypothetical protein